MKVRRLVNPPDSNNYNLHRIAITNLNDPERQVIRWWCKKYQTPAKGLDDHTIEELIIEMLEDFYEANPAEVGKFLANEAGVQEWDGTTSDEYEKRMAKVWKRKAKIDVSQFQDSAEVSEEEEAAILANLGRNLPGSKGPKKGEASTTLGGEDFEDNFEG